MTDFPLVRDLFPADDLVAQWVFALTATAADISEAERPFRDAMDSDLPVRVNYRYRQLIARIYEAERVVVAIDRHQEVADFLAEIEATGPAVRFLRETYVPHATSRARSAFGGMRHRTVHHSHVGSNELRDALVEAGDEEARLLMDHTKGRALYEWPEAVAMRVLVGDGSDPKVRQQFKESATLAQEIAQAFASLVGLTLRPYCERVGVDGLALMRHIRET
jgi:hypothetical protein